VVEQREEFVARKIGHDTATTNYRIDRTPRQTQTTTTTAAAAPTQALGAGSGRTRFEDDVIDGPMIRRGPLNSQAGLATFRSVGAPLVSAPAPAPAATGLGM
jgi:hypothetical protein